MKIPAWKYIFATLSFWIIAFLGDIVLLLLNAISPSWSRYDGGTLGYYLLCLVSSAISAVVAVIAADNILKELKPRFVFVNCVIASIGFSIIAIASVGENAIFSVKVILAVAVFIINAVKYKRSCNNSVQETASVSSTVVSTEPSYHAPLKTDGHTKKENRVGSLVKNGTIGLLATNTALFYYIIRYVFPYGAALDVDQALFAAAIIDTAPYWKTNEMTKRDVECALDLAKAGTVKIGSYEVSHSLVSSDSEKELLYNLAMQLQAMKHYVDNNVDERDPVDMVVNFKSQIISIIDDTLQSGQNHPKYNDALRIVTEYMDRQDYWELVFNYGLDPKAIEEMKAHKNNTQHKLEQPPAANYPAPEIDITPEPAPPVEPELEPDPEPEPAPEPAPVKDPTSIDLSCLTDEQRALVSQLVDSMKK